MFSTTHIPHGFVYLSSNNLLDTFAYPNRVAAQRPIIFFFKVKSLARLLLVTKWVPKFSDSQILEYYRDLMNHMKNNSKRNESP